MIWMLGRLTLSHKSLRLSSLLLILFFFLPLCLICFHYSIFHLTYPIFCLSYSTVDSLQSFWSQLLHYSLLIHSFLFLLCLCHGEGNGNPLQYSCLENPMDAGAWWAAIYGVAQSRTRLQQLSSSMSLSNISCIIWILFSRLFICNSILFSIFWIIFTIIFLNAFSDRLPISSSFVWFGVHLSYSFTWWIFICLFILFWLLCLGWPYCMLEVCGSSLLWRFLPVGGVTSVGCQSFLVREACVNILLGGVGSLLFGVHWSVQ